MCWLFNWEQYYYALVSALFGLAIGSWVTNRKWKQDIDVQSQKLKQDLFAAFQFNIDRINQCVQYLESSPPNIPNFSLDESSVLQILHDGRKLFENPNDFQKFNWQRFQLSHLNKKLDFLISLAGHTSELAGHTSEVGDNVRTELVGHLKTTAKEISLLLEQYKT